MNQLQQGDVLFMRVGALPTANVTEDKKNTEYGKPILAYGEVTGHKHQVALAEASKLFNVGSEVYLEVFTETQVVHEEHKPITLVPGVYKVGIVEEVDHFVEAAKKRKVKD